MAAAAHRAPAAGKVVALARKGGGYTMPREVIDDLRLRMYAHRAIDLADEVGCSVSCIYAIRAGSTTWPRGHTLFGLVKAVGLRITLVDAATGRPLR